MLLDALFRSFMQAVRAEGCRGQVDVTGRGGGGETQRAGSVRKLYKIEYNDSRVRADYPYVTRAEVM